MGDSAFVRTMSVHPARSKSDSVRLVSSVRLAPLPSVPWQAELAQLSDVKLADRLAFVPDDDPPLVPLSSGPQETARATEAAIIRILTIKTSCAFVNVCLVGDSGRRLVLSLLNMHPYRIAYLRVDGRHVAEAAGRLENYMREVPP